MWSESSGWSITQYGIYLLLKKYAIYELNCECTIFLKKGFGSFAMVTLSCASLETRMRMSDAHAATISPLES